MLLLASAAAGGDHKGKQACSVFQRRPLLSVLVCYYYGNLTGPGCPQAMAGWLAAININHLYGKSLLTHAQGEFGLHGPLSVPSGLYGFMENKLVTSV